MPLAYIFSVDGLHNYTSWIKIIYTLLIIEADKHLHFIIFDEKPKIQDVNLRHKNTWRSSKRRQL